MPESQTNFYLTTPIYYVNARPHIGHAYSTIAADVLARRHRLMGEDVFFLTGTDEHGQKVQRSAAAAGIPPQQFTDEVSATFKGLWDRMGITYSDFIRTTEPRHKRGVEKLWRELESRGAIYLDSYTGAYCVSDEAFVDLPAGSPCPDCGRLLETVTEENYFFRLSAYADKLVELIESGRLHIQPEAVKNEVLSFVRGGLKDLSISRTTFDWGIQVPGNPKHVVYVWLDALANYITAIGYGAELRDDLTAEQKAVELEKFARYWPANIHLVGKEITRFHCVYWPAFLMAAELPVPKSVVANGWLLFEESKMSKSRGNVVRAETILDAFGEHYRASLAAHNAKLAPNSAGSSEATAEPDKRDCDLFAADVMRYFLLREIPFGQDGSFSFDAMITRYNADLANGYGNLVSRTLNMIHKYFGGVVPIGTMDERLGLGITLRTAAVTNNYAEEDFSSLLQNLMELVSAADGLITSKAPWKLAADKSKSAELADVLYSAAESIRIINDLIEPVLPFTASLVFAQLGIPGRDKDGESRWGQGQLGPLAPIFPRAPKELAQTMADMETANTPQKPTPVPPGPSPLNDDFEDVKPKEQPSEPRPSDPSAPPRASSSAADNPGAHVGGSAALTTERPGTPSHTEAQASGVFAAAQASHVGSAAGTPQITIEDFVKIELRVAQVVVAERIPKADKLLRLEVDLGYEKRQILSGIAQWYTPEELIGRRIAVIANLAPRKMRGLDSHGMLLAASDEADPNGKPVLASFSDDIALGSRIR
jgi:methionyl-tRNA synthetase